MGHYKPEKYQIGALKQFFNKKGFEYIFEANMYSIPIDVLCKKGDTVMAIELKSRNSKRGIEQALRNLYFADYSFISVWEDNITSALIERVENEPIGLIAIGHDVKFISPPSKNDVEKYPRNKAEQVITSGV